ncbi:uncharacterized protein LOC105926145 [Fundulus heteroclitus]|uniref:uncharacterized protein LOC105926145 n=1 Tax=Fundulus heteroclitus TaxID=8078 RepID=UPI00165CB1AF|nr:uncharacterized protein LOC105926145 [Fundulus heteroclitus]
MKPSWLPLAELSSSPQKRKDSRRNMDVCTASSRGHAKRRVGKKNRNWHGRLHLRKAVVQPPAMQSPDKHGPKKTAKRWEPTAAWPPSTEPPQEAGVASDGGGALRFPCSRCADASEYAPRDLVRHFVEKHRGSPPVFPCHRCTFSAREFSYLQVHLLSHEDTFSSCSMCGDNVQRTWPEFSAHLATRHCSDGSYSCGTCGKFATFDLREFLEHVCKHNPSVGAVDGRDKDRLPGPPAPCCQFCGFEPSGKWLAKNRVRGAHVCQNGDQRKDRRQVHSVATKASDPHPRAKTRLTRSTVRDTCWLTHDCLSLPGKEFLGKYCHLSDPQTTLEETQEFLMQSVAGETDDQKWTKALQSVLSNVPQKSPENGVAADLAVLTVKNKITVAQNGGAYPKRLKVTPADKDVARPEGEGDRSGPDLNRKRLAPQADGEPRDDCSTSGENRKSTTGSEIQENGREPEEPVEVEGTCKSRGLKLTSEGEAKASAGRLLTKGKAQKRRRRRRARFKKAQRRSAIQEKQWVPQSSSPPQDEAHLVGIVQPEHRVDQNCTQGPPADSADPSEHAAVCQSEDKRDPLESFPPTRQRAPDGVEESRESSDESTSDEGAEEAHPPAASGTPREDLPLQESRRSSEGEGSEERRGATAGTPHEEVHLVHSSLDDPTEQRHQIAEGLRNEEVPAPPSPRLLQQEPSPAAGRQRQPLPKHQQRTLKLVAINSSQPVKRPAGDQPVVVLNHPDADIPQVSRIMEVVNRYREVRKVLLSRRTLRALSAPGGEAPEADDDDAAAADQGEISVQERFTLRLKFRRLSRKKYEVVGVASPGRDAAARFSCWFCGRVFTSQAEMMAHRQRHLMDWKKPNCE